MTSISNSVRTFLDALSFMQSQELPPFEGSFGYLKNITDFFCNRVKQLRIHESKFEFIEKAIQQIPKRKHLNSSNVIHVLKIFNCTIARYGRMLHPIPPVSCVQELKELEQKIEDRALQKLWDALWFDSLPFDAIDPKLKTIAQKRKWFEDERNQPLLDTVTHLELVNCGIIRLPREIFKLRNLEELDLSENLIEVLPESIKVWEKLEVLDLFDNKLRYLPQNGIKYLVELNELNVSHNQLTDLPQSIKKCKNLNKLDLIGNYLQELPSAIGGCVSLQTLKISLNRIKKLPIEIKNLTSLVRFYAAGNELSYSSEELQALGLHSWRQVKRVDLSQNNLNTTIEFLQTLWPNAATIRYDHFEEECMI